MFYTFVQNNSGGQWDKNHNIRERVIIEADDFGEANRRAEDVGIYFYGVQSGYDCECCGSRWHEMYDEDDGTPTPSLYGVPIAEDEIVFEDPDRLFEVIIHYKDGRIGYWKDWH